MLILIETAQHGQKRSSTCPGVPVKTGKPPVNSEKSSLMGRIQAAFCEYRVKAKGLQLVKVALKVKLIYSLHVNSGKYTNVVTFLHIFTILEG